MSLTVNNKYDGLYLRPGICSSSYNKLSDSTRKLSSGLRVDTAADDAAGLAIRELMRSDIAALNQGVRNANDGISLIQTADGALSVIDEKFIRMKALAEQAATGTYDSTQRLLIDSEYQQMASQITRIANATDFNGIKLLDGALSGTHSGSGLEFHGRAQGSLRYGQRQRGRLLLHQDRQRYGVLPGRGQRRLRRREAPSRPRSRPKRLWRPCRTPVSVQGQHPCPFGRQCGSRLENTISNLQIQAEKLQAAESRIPDVDVASEMTNFRQEPDSYPVGRGHVFAGQFPAATGLESAVILPRQPARRYRVSIRNTA